MGVPSRMGVRSRLADLGTVLVKRFGQNKPTDVAAGETAAGMDVTRPFSPGEPIGPYDGYSRTPRSRDFVPGYNIAARPRSHERVAFETLKGLVEAYDVAQTCIWHRIDSIRALEWSLVPVRGFSGDADTAIDRGMAALEKPDRKTPFPNWLAKWLYDVLAYDAGTLYRMRNRGGRPIGLKVVDGTLVAPLLDYWGDSPEPPAEAYVQYVHGLPWNWLTRDDLVYEPFRPVANSPYGRAPLESVLLNANTDLRFQAYFLQRFTEGNIPEAFASAPETWSPNQIEQFQEYWDAFMLGDQSVKHQIRWIPGGSSIAWSNEKDFQDHFSLFLMRKTCAAFHVVPADLGFTESVNRSSGETQADVQHRVGDLPLIAHIQGILTTFLRKDLGLPLQFLFDTGQEKDDRLAQAQAWEIYISSGMASPDEGREKLLGLPGDPQRPTPRFYATNRLGPVPLLSIQGVSGKVDSETFGPAPDQPVLYQPFVAAPGVVPAAGTTDAKASLAAEDAYQLQVRDQLEGQTAQPGPVAKDGTPTVGVTAETGIVSYDLNGRSGSAGRHRAPDDEDDPDEAQRAELVKRELAAFRNFRAARRRSGAWRDFTFVHTDPVTGHRLNDAGRLAVRKAAGQVAVAGLAVRAADTGRVLMLQRALDDDDPAGGTLEFPGGHIEEGETPLRAAWREWSEETGCIPPPGECTGEWTSSNDIYQGIVWTVTNEACVPVRGDAQVGNPDDPDGDCVEAVMWVDPDHLVDNPMVRPELAADLVLVLTALGGDPPGELVKAGGGPKDPAPAPDWPGWEWDQQVADHWAPLIADATGSALTEQRAAQVVAAYQSTDQPSDDTSRDAAVATVALWLARQDITATPQLTQTLTGLYADAYLIGAASASALLDGGKPDLGGWRPGDTATTQDRLAQLDGTPGLADLLDTAPDMAAGILDTRTEAAARVLLDGTAAGDSTANMTAGLLAAFSNIGGARTVAVTEVVAASSVASMALYVARGVEWGRWVTDPSGNVCALCIANADAGPVRIGDAYPSGHSESPAHPHCRCEVVPAGTRTAGGFGGAAAAVDDEEAAATESEAEAGAAEAVATTEASLESSVATGVTDREVLGGGVSAETSLVTFADGTRAVEKVARSYAEREPDEATDAETLAAKLGRAIGVQVPDAVRTADNTVYLAYVADAETGMEKALTDRALAELADTTAGRQLGLFDLLTQNTDRNTGNWLVDGGGGLWGIDHGWAFNEFSTTEGMQIVTGRNPFAGGLLQMNDAGEVTGGSGGFSLVDLDHLRTALTGLQGDFTSLGRESWYQQTLDRLDWLAQHATGDGTLFG